MKKKRLLIIPCALLLAALAAAGIAARQFYLERYYVVSCQSAPYEDTARLLSNPYCGWYRIYGYALSDSAPPDMEAMQKNIASDDNELVLLELNLRNYAASDISPTGLAQLESILSAWEASGKQLILRFLYDWDGKARETEPDDISVIKRHMEQAAKAVNRHKSCVYLLQGIFVGNCGEMNNSNYMAAEQMRELAAYLDSVIDKSIFLSVRTPAHYRAISQSFDPLPAEKAFSGAIEARTGLFNDGMLGSASDLGTYGETPLAEAADFNGKGTRAEEIAFQNALCQYVPNGGEAVLDNEYNDFPNAVADLREMHVSYLDCGYDLAVLEKWRGSSYGGDGCFHGGDGCSYIGAHLGYRYAFRSSDCSFDPFRDGTAAFSLTIENSGFANSYRPFSSVVTVLREDGSVCDAIPVRSDARLWKSGESVTLQVPLDVCAYKEGTYRIYYRLSDPALDGRTILFANTLSLSEYGYPIATLTVEK